MPFLSKVNFPLTNLVNFFFLENLFFSFANIGFSAFKPKDLNNNGITKNLKQATEEMGLPGKPKKHLLLLNFETSD